VPDGHPDEPPVAQEGWLGCGTLSDHRRLLPNGRAERRHQRVRARAVEPRVRRLRRSLRGEDLAGGACCCWTECNTCTRGRALPVHQQQAEADRHELGPCGQVRAKLETGKWKEIPGRIRDLDELWAWFFDVIRHYDWPEFEKRCKKHSIAHGKVLRAADEVLQDAQVVANDIVATVESSAGAHRLARPAAKFSATPCSIRHAAPLLGQHTAELKAQIAAKSL
jgi:hypothetical protein